MKRCGGFRSFLLSAILDIGESAYYRTRGGEWRGCIAATPHEYMVSATRKGINEWRKK